MVEGARFIFRGLRIRFLKYFRKSRFFHQYVLNSKFFLNKIIFNIKYNGKCVLFLWSAHSFFLPKGVYFFVCFKYFYFSFSLYYFIFLSDFHSYLNGFSIFIVPFGFRFGPIFLQSILFLYFFIFIFCTINIFLNIQGIILKYTLYF